MSTPRAFLIFALCTVGMSLSMWVGTLSSEASSDAYAWYDVECSGSECIRFNPQNGESWILACPGTMTSCAWEPLEVREP